MELGLHALRFYDRANSLPKAAEHFENILAHNPKNAAAMAGLALTYSFRYAGDEKDELWLKKAHASVQAALNINPQLALAHAAHARILNQQLNDVPALIAAERALALAPMDVFALTAKFNILYSSRRFEEAKNFASAALQRHPQERIFADSLGSALYNLGNFEEAERAFRRSLEIEPDAVFAYSNLSSVLMAKGRSEEALQVLQQGLQVRPNSVLYTNLGHALFLKADYVNAALAFEQAISPTKGNPADYKAWANLGDTLLWLPGRREQAQLTYQKAAELLQPLLAKSPQDATMVSRMGLYLQRAGNSAEATTLSIRALALAPADANVHFRAALVFELQGNRTRAISAIQHARRLGYPKSYIEGEPDFLALRRDPHYIP
jgi:serine/threonine-protein kinase